MKKRWRAPKAKPGEIKVAYGKERWDEPDIYYCHGGQGASRADARIVSSALEGVKILDDKNLRQLLEERGYDITTLKFSIQQKQ